ncbi:MAG: hypothetical protein R3D88_07635 [Alphaproteobacteria bacterium]|nr:hypothetical protein [Alphaproteobacteria bacterium]
MTKLSSTRNRVFINIFMLIWFSGLFWMVYTKYQDGLETNFDFFFIGMAVFMGFAAYKAINNMNNRLFDEVYDHDNHIIATKNNKKYKIEYSNIMNVNYSDHPKAGEVTLMLRNPVSGKDKICFKPITDSVFVSKSSLIEKLIVKIHNEQTNS